MIFKNENIPLYTLSLELFFKIIFYYLKKKMLSNSKKVFDRLLIENNFLKICFFFYHIIFRNKIIDISIIFYKALKAIIDNMNNIFQNSALYISSHKICQKKKKKQFSYLNSQT